MEERELICIGCPLGCPLTVRIEKDQIEVKGNTCNRGAEYGKREVLNPVRTLTSTVRVNGGEIRMVSVKTKEDIPKDKIFACMAELSKVTVQAPVAIGDVIIPDCGGTKIPVIATKNVRRAEGEKAISADIEKKHKLSLLEETSLFVVDMDGTFYCGEKLIEGAIDFLKAVEKRGKRFLFFTNNSSKAPEDYIRKLHRLGCDIGRDQIKTSGDVTIRYLKKYYPDKRVYLVGSPALRASFQKEGIRLVDQEADIVLAAFDTTLTYEKLERACTMIRKGALFLATHPDINCPVEGGFIPDCGAICAAISLSTGKKPKMLGKPFWETVEMIQEELGVEPAQMGFVGDRLYTDIAVGVHHGAKGFLVLTGETSMKDLENSETIPDGVFSSLGEMGRLLEEGKNGETEAGR